MSDHHTFQRRVNHWGWSCFGPEIWQNKVERNYRFLEESLELVQALGCTRDDALRLVDYVYGRLEGAPAQEVGGVMVTLAALCQINDLDMMHCGEIELDRVWRVIDRIRQKQMAKTIVGPIP